MTSTVQTNNGSIAGGIANGLLAAAIVGLFLTIGKIVFQEVSVIFFSFCVMAGTNFFYLLYLLAKGKKASIIKAGKSYPELYLVGLFAATLTLMENWGLKLSLPTNAGILMRADLFFSLLIGYFLWRERLRPLEWVGMATMLMGISQVLQLSLTNFHFGSAGDVMLLGSALLLAVNAEIIKHRLHGVEDIIVAYFNSGICALAYFALAISHNELWPLPQASGLTWALILACTLIQVTHYLTYYRSLHDLPAWLARVLCLATSVAAVLSSAWWLQEKVTLHQIWGMLLVTTGIILLCWLQKRRSGGDNMNAVAVPGKFL
ncbi:DMT family transporter [Moorella naiadis]|uniref:DMT family transporter n=1 Tax=Moorella naiadis (nom. illeg.) TaxID=3093670 RepID=UPI003D9CAB6E